MLLRASILLVSCYVFSPANATVIDQYIFDASGTITSSSSSRYALVGDQVNFRFEYGSVISDQRVIVNDSLVTTMHGDVFPTQLDSHIKVHNTDNPESNDYILFRTVNSYDYFDYETEDSYQAGYFVAELKLYFDYDFLDERLDGSMVFLNIGNSWGATELEEELLISALYDSDQATSISGYFYKNNYVDRESGNFRYSVNEFNVSPPQPVPLPAAAWLFISGIGGCCIFRRTKK